MRALGTVSTWAIVLFWLLMNTMLVKRELERSSLDHYQRGVSAFLGSERKRERWLSIYRKTEEKFRKVGYSGFTMEKVYSVEGLEYHATIETYLTGSLPFQGFISEYARDSSSVLVKGELVLDSDMIPVNLQLDIRLSVMDLHIGGRRDGDRFRVSVAHGDNTLELPLPLESLTLADGLSPALPIAGYGVGDTYRVRVFNPLTPLGMGEDTATVRVIGERTEDVHGTAVDVYELETEWRGAKTRSLVTAAGELIQQELGPPLNLVLHHETRRENAARDFRR